MSKIFVNSLITKAFSNEQAEILRDEIRRLLATGTKKIEIDFADITVYTTLFFNFSTGVFIKELGKEQYDRMFEVVNLNELGESTYNHSYNNCIRDEIKGNEDINAKIMDILNGMDE